MGKTGKIILIIWAVLMTLIAGGLIGFEVLRIMGKTNLESKSATTAPILAQTQPTIDTQTKESQVWENDWVRYNGAVYDYNEDIKTFLIMGIDKDDEKVTAAEDETDGGQADALFLLVINPNKESIRIIGINRNTMTDVDIYDDYGRYMTTIKAQIAVQHGFGNGMEESCKYQVKAVSKLFYQLPIHGYAAINMSAIPTINDLVGGVDVTVLEDLTKADKKLVEGEEIHLEGKDAFYYVKYRDIGIFGSSDSRLNRQRQYLNGFIKAFRKTCAENNNAAIELFTAVKDKMVTDISADEVSYLAPDMVKYTFDSNDFKMIKGETKMGEEFEEFYIDENDLYETIIDTFYDKIDYVD